MELAEAIGTPANHSYASMGRRGKCDWGSPVHDGSFPTLPPHKKEQEPEEQRQSRAMGQVQGTLGWYDS